MTHKLPPLLFYDGVCNFCDASVQFVLEHEQAPTIRFAALQDPIATTLLQPFALDPQELDTVIFLVDGVVYTRSRAVFAVAAHLRAPYSALSWLRFVPSFLSDIGYRLFARLRYRLFGRRDSCRIPTPGERARFLVDVPS
jgi:predicted DCC family thiol-disulfide oxidoreductase YuxK